MWRYVFFGALGGMFFLAAFSYGLGWVDYYFLGVEAPSISWKLSERHLGEWLINRAWAGLPLGGATAYAWRLWCDGAKHQATAVCQWAAILCLIVINSKPQNQAEAIEPWLEYLPGYDFSPSSNLVYWVHYVDLQWALLLLVISIILKRRLRHEAQKQPVKID